MAEFKPMRLFFALWPDEETRQQLWRIAAELSAGGGRAHHPMDLHITLAFLGLQEGARIHDALAIGDRVSGRPFDIKLDHTGYWPKARVNWCAPGDTPALLEQLVAELREQLLQDGFELDLRPYRPHVTLLRKGPSQAVTPLPRPIQWQASEFVLAGSEKGATPPRYQILKKWPLGS